MKKKIFRAIVAVITLTFILSACTAKPASDTDQSGSANENPSAPAEVGGAAAEKLSSYDQLMALLDDPSADILALSGIQPKSYESRENVGKALPVKPKDKLTIAWAGASLGTEFFEGLKSGAEASCEKYGYTLNYQNADFNLETQGTQADSFISQGVDAMVLNAVDLHSSGQLINRVVQAGIPILVTGPTSAKADYSIITAVVADSIDGAFQVGAYFAEKIYAKEKVLKVGWVVSKLEDSDSNARPCGWIAGFLYKSAEMNGNPYTSKYDAILEAYNIWLKYKADFKYDLSDKGLNLVDLGVGQGNDAAAGQKASSDMLTANPDMDILMCEMDAEVVGALAEIKQHNLVPGKDIMVGTCADGTRNSLDLIKSGEMLATAANSPYTTATAIIDLFHKIFAEGYDANNLPATSYTPMTAITPENVDKYYDPAQAFAKAEPWEPITIAEYNEFHAND